VPRVRGGFLKFPIRSLVALRRKAGRRVLAQVEADVASSRWQCSGCVRSSIRVSVGEGQIFTVADLTLLEAQEGAGEDLPLLDKSSAGASTPAGGVSGSREAGAVPSVSGLAGGGAARHPLSSLVFFS